MDYDKKVSVILTTEQIDRIINELISQYGDDEMLPFGELKYFLTERYTAHDPLGLNADIKDYDVPLQDWELISRMGLSFEKVVLLYGKPPEEAMKWFIK